jgi:hypothetical protein
MAPEFFFFEETATCHSNQNQEYNPRSTHTNFPESTSLRNNYSKTPKRKAKNEEAPGGPCTPPLYRPSPAAAEAQPEKRTNFQHSQIFRTPSQNKLLCEPIEWLANGETKALGLVGRDSARAHQISEPLSPFDAVEEAEQLRLPATTRRAPKHPRIQNSRRSRPRRGRAPSARKLLYNSTRLHTDIGEDAAGTRTRPEEQKLHQIRR